LQQSKLTFLGQLQPHPNICCQIGTQTAGQLAGQLTGTDPMAAKTHS